MVVSVWKEREGKEEGYATRGERSKSPAGGLWDASPRR